MVESQKFYRCYLKTSFLFAKQFALISFVS